MKRLKGFAFIALLLVTVLVFTGCSSPSGSKELTAYELVKSAVEKNAALPSSELKVGLNIKMSLMGMTMEIPSTYNIKTAKTDKGLEASAVMEMSVMGESLTNDIYTDSENVYISMKLDDEPLKYKLALSDELAASYDVSEMGDKILQVLPEDILKDVQIIKDDNGSQKVTVSISEEKFNEIFKEYTDDVLNEALAELSGESETSITVSNANADITINKDGYVTDYNLTFDINLKVDIQGISMDLTASCESTCSYVNPGSQVTVDKPADLDKYIDYRSVIGN